MTATDSAGELLPFNDIIAQFEGTGLSASDAMLIFGQRAGPGMLELVRQGSGLCTTREMELSGGTAQQIAKDKLDTFLGQLTKLASAGEGLALVIGEGIVPVLRPLAETLTKVVQGVVAWAEANPTLFSVIAIGVTVLGALAAGAGLLLIAVGAIAPGIAVLIPLITGLNIAMLANPAVLIAAAIIGLVAAGVLLYKNWDKVKAAAETVWNSIGGIVEAGINIVIDILNAYTLIQRKTLVALVNGIGLVAKAFGKDLPESVREFTDAIDEGIPHVDIFQETLQDTTVVTADASRPSGAIR